MGRTIISKNGRFEWDEDKYRLNKKNHGFSMTTSKKLNPRRIKEIMKIPITYNKDCPKLTANQIARMKPAHPEYWKVEPIKVSISIKIDADILAWFKTQGKGYQTRINSALRNVMLSSM